MSDTLLTVAVAAVVLAAGFGWQGIRTAAIPVSSPERLVAELRLAQIAALILATTTAPYIGFAVDHAQQPGSGIHVALAIGFFLSAATTLVREPRQALTILAIAFAAHAVVDVANGQGTFLPDVTPDWYALGCALFNVYMGGIAYLPILRR